MSIQPFACIGGETINDERLGAVSWMAQVLWYKIYQSVDGHWRFSDDPEEIRGVCFAKCSRARVSDVAHCLSELKAAGLVLPRAAGTESWVEVPVEFRHRPRSHRDPRWGIIEPPQVQGELALGPVALSPPQPKPGLNRLETNKKRTINRAVCGEEELIDSLREILPRSEMINNGGGWRTRIRHCKRAVRYAIEDWKLRTADQRMAIKNRAAWLTDRYARALVEIDQARKQA